MFEVFVPVEASHVAGSVTSYLFAFLAFTLMYLTFQFYWGRRKLYSMAAKFPGPPTVPIIGNAQIFFGINDSETIYEVIKRLASDNMKYLSNSPVRLWLGPQLGILVAKPEDLYVVLTSPHSMEKAEGFYKCMQPIMGTPLLYKPVPLWKPHRKLFHPAFSRMKCFGMVNKFVDACDDFMEDLKLLIPQGITAQNLGNIIDLNIMKSVCITLLGVESNDVNRLQTFLEYSRWLIDIEFQRMCKVWLHSDFLFKLTKDYQLEVDNIAIARKMIDWVLETRREIRAKKKKLRARNIPFKDETVLADVVLDMRESGEFTEQQLRDEIILFFGAGMDTTTFATYITLMMIAMHEDVQEKIYEELYNIFGDSERPVEANDIREMKYLEMVAKESMRMYPPIAVVARYATQDIKLDSYTIPAGSIIFPSPYAVHHNPSVWPEPEKFDPERFHPDKKRHPYSYIPFSAGPRNCIGYTFASIFMKTLISMVLRKYKLSTECKHSDIRIKLTLTAKLIEAKPIIFEERKRKEQL